MNVLYDSLGLKAEVRKRFILVPLPPLPPLWQKKKDNIIYQKWRKRKKRQRGRTERMESTVKTSASRIESLREV